MSSSARGQSLNAQGNSNTVGSIFTTGGNVGINTTSPGYKFHVVASNAGDSVTIENTNASGFATTVYKTPSISYFSGVGGGSTVGFNNKFYIINLTNTSAFVMGSTGNIGISTTNPSYTLDINGTINASGTINTNWIPSCTFTNNSTVGSNGIASFLAPNMPANTSVFSYFGKSLSVGNCGSIGYIYAGANNAGSVMSLTHYGKGGGLSVNNDGNVGIGTTSPVYTLDVSGTIARSGVKLPRFDNGTFSGASTAVIPILFNDTQYNYVEIKVRFQVSAACNVTLLGSTSSNGSSPFAGQEMGETTVKYNSQGSPVYTTTGLISQTTEQLNIDNNFTIRITRASGGSNGRNKYSFETVYCWSNVGTAKVYGMGRIDTASNLSNALLSIVMSTNTGTIAGSYSTQHSY